LLKQIPISHNCCCYWQTRLRPTGNYLSARPTGEPICPVEAGRLGGSFCLLGKPSLPQSWGCLCEPRTPLTSTALLTDSTREEIAGDRSLPTVAAQLPDAKETGTALLQLANMAKPKDALTYLDQVISRFPNQAGEALIEKAEILTPSRVISQLQVRQLLQPLRRF